MSPRPGMGLASAGRTFARQAGRLRCAALIDFGAKEMATHMLDAHGIHFNKWRPVLCMWPDCHDTPKGTRSALAWMTDLPARSVQFTLSPTSTAKASEITYSYTCPSTAVHTTFVPAKFRVSC
ncbi:hypothetical protein C8R44DRAFT_753397 [Mycena epipterygia]|nr:hypothetical protein C8R44DRAFT_753397 [Mycena epipterygia]